MVTRRDWWIGVALIVLALVAHAVVPLYVPRYRWQHQDGISRLRADRWPGNAELVPASRFLARQFPIRQ